jgi:hypothetical protein
VASASALVSGLGNFGSIMSTYALYTGGPEDAQKGPHQYRKSNLVMVGILCLSILSSISMAVLLKVIGNNANSDIVRGGTSAGDDKFQDGAGRRELRQRGFRGG